MQPAEYLSKKGIQYKVRGENLVFNCPFCEDREEKAAMHRETGVYNCMHHNKCGAKGTFFNFQQRMGDTPAPRSYDDFIHLPAKKKYVKPKVHPKALNDEHRKFLNGRGITDELIEEFSLRSENGAIAFPYKKDGELVAVKYRTLDKKFWRTKDSEPVLFNRDSIDSDSLIICEGEIDAMSYRTYGYYAVSVPSGVSDTTWIENEWDWLERFPRIYISMDMDEAGRGAVEVLAERLGLWRCYDIRLPYKDINECLTNGVSGDEIDDAVRNAQEFHIREIVGPREYADEVVRILTEPGYAHGRSTGFDKLDRILRGWRWGELTVWSGRNGSGKTTLLNQLVLEGMKQHGDKVFIASLEMKPSKILAWMVQQGGVSGDERKIRLALEAMQQGVYLFNKLGKVDPDLIVDVFEFAAKKYGCKHFILDSLMRVSLKSHDKYEQQEELVNSLVSFAQKFNVHVHLVAHPRKSMSDTDKPGKVDISGSADITNLAHNVLILYKPTYEEHIALREKKQDFDAMLFVRKNREFGDEGQFALTFDQTTRRFDQKTLL